MTTNDSKPHSAEPQSVASQLAPVLTSFLGERPPLRFEFWDGSAFGETDAKATVQFCSIDAIRYLARAPGELGLARAYVTGAIDITGDLFYAFGYLTQFRPRVSSMGTRLMVRSLGTIVRMGALSGRPPVPPEEAHTSGRLHSKARDASVISHHYDVGNDFYELFLGSTMTYSCARFTDESDGLDKAQEDKYDLICRKLGLREGMRLLDVGCGWGGMLLHAARHYGVNSVGITLSEEQAQLARRRVMKADSGNRVEIRVQDYRDLSNEQFDAISSIGMFEHVGRAQMSRYFSTLAGVLKEGGRLLNHAIDSPGGTAMTGRGFIARYVFPDGELQDLSVSLMGMQDAGFEVRDVESLREHYAKTLRYWVANLEENWSRAVELVGEARARVWRAYMAGSAVSFEANRISVHQSLGVKTCASGDSLMPLTRHSFV